MGHSHGIKWTDEMVKKEIRKVMESLNIDRMPSRKEIELVTQNSSLTNKISKSGGFYHWAERLGLGIKSSETSLAIIKEKEIAEYITERLGWETELTPLKFPYDILVGGVVKIDVKFSNGYDYGNGRYFSFNLEYTMPKCDVLVLVCSKEKTLVIPAHVFLGKNQVSIGNESKYDKYQDRWDIINMLHESMWDVQDWTDEPSEVIHNPF